MTETQDFGFVGLCPILPIKTVLPFSSPLIGFNPNVCFEPVFGGQITHIRPYPDDLYIVRINSQRKDRDTVVCSTANRINFSITLLPGQAIIVADMHPGVGICHISDVGIVEVAADIVAEATGRSAPSHPGPF